MLHSIMEINHSSTVPPSPKVRGAGGISGLWYKPMMNTMKRARSPESAQEEDRPMKRSANELPLEPLSLGPGVPSSSTSHQPNDDWVRQASGLRIDSPLFPVGVSQHTTIGNNPNLGLSSDMSQDVEMVPDESSQEQMQLSQERHLPTPIPDHLDQISNFAAQLQPGNQHGFQYREDNTATGFVDLAPSTILNIENAFYNRPPHPLSAQSYVPSPETSLSSTFSSGPTPMPISPHGSFTITESAASQKHDETKRRVVKFGPRTNCPMCKQGVPHFAHYDYE